MRLVLGFTLLAVMGLVTVAAADDQKDSKIDGKKLIGKWTPKDPKKEAGLTIEFAKDGKMFVFITIAGKEEKIEGTYSLDGDKLKVGLKFMAKEKQETMTITKLTDDELETVDSKMSKELLIRVKSK